MTVNPSAAAPSYAPPSAPREYNPHWLRDQLASISRALPPRATRTVTAATTQMTTDDTVLGNTTGGNFAIKLLPAAQWASGKTTFKNIGTGTLTITGTVDGSANPTLAQNKAMTLQSDGTAIWKIAAV